MKVLFFLYSILLSFLVGLGNANTKPTCTGPEPQCGQFCVYHICRLKGIPATLGQITEIFPPKEGGDSLLDLSDTLEKLGFQCTGKKVTFNELLNEPFPLIAYFQDKGGGHFVVVEEAMQGRIKVFYGNGQRGTMSFEQFAQKWSGIALIITNQTFVRPPFMQAATPGKPWIQFDTLFLDAGDIPQEEEEVTFCFPFHNAGEGDLVLEEVKTSCGCVAVRDDYKKIIPPGGSDILTVLYKFSEGRGRFSQSVWVKSNDSYYPVIELSLNGNGLRNVLVDPARLNFGEIVQGQKETRQGVVHYDGDFPLEIRSVKPSHSYLFAEAKPLTLKDIQVALPQGKPLSIPDFYNKYFLNVTIDTSTLDIGEYRGKIEIETNLHNSTKLTVPIYATVISPIRILPSKLFLGEVQRGDCIEKTITVSSLRNSEIQILSVDTSQTKFAAQFSKEPAANIGVKFTGIINNSEQIEGQSIEISLLEISTGKKIKCNLPVCGLVRILSRP